MFDRETLDHLKCVQLKCSGNLINKNGLNPELSCELCKYNYKSVSGIPLLYSKENLSTLNKKSWNQKVNTDSYTDKYLKKDDAPWSHYTDESEIY